MYKQILAASLLLSCSVVSQAQSVALDCQAPEQVSFTGGANAQVERDFDSVTVETRLWVGRWHISQQGGQGFRAELAAVELKPAASRMGERDVLREVQTLSLDMKGPAGGFRLGQRYPCAMAETLAALDY